jgi:hypothetical protein
VGESGTLFFFLTLEYVQFSPICYDVGYRCVIYRQYIPSISGFFQIFIIKSILNFVKGFFCINWDDHVILSLILFICCITFTHLHMMNHPCITGMKPTWSWFMIFFMCCFGIFTSIWEFLHLCSLIRLIYNVFVVVLPWKSFGMGLILAS